MKRLPHGEGLPLPAYATSGAAGMDVVSAEDVVIAPQARYAVATGLALAIPHGFEIQVRPRSGLALKHGITVPNTPGTIDSDYRGELKVILINHGAEPFSIARGDRVAQLVLAPVVQGAWPVSYTHLDVYKRQPLCRWRGGLWCGRRWGRFKVGLRRAKGHHPLMRGARFLRSCATLQRRRQYSLRRCDLTHG